MSEATAIGPYADHDHMANHWWWRPGWQIGTRFYAWHITLDGQDDLHRLMDDYYVDALRPFPTLDPVPRQWRHITLQGLGHVEDVTDSQRDAAIEAVAARVKQLKPIESIFQRAAIFKEAIALPPSNPDAFAQLRAEIRAGIAEPGAIHPKRQMDSGPTPALPTAMDRATLPRSGTHSTYPVSRLSLRSPRSPSFGCIATLECTSGEPWQNCPSVEGNTRICPKEAGAVFTGFADERMCERLPAARNTEWKDKRSSSDQ